MRPLLCLFAACLPVLSFSAAVEAEPDQGTGTAYVIPIKGMIERALVYVIRRGVDQAERENAEAIIFDMDTPGGRVDAAREIVNLIGNLDVPTYTFVNPDAISAGAIIAMATDHIYMAPGSRIGDAMPLMMTPIGGPQQVPESVEEKSVSYVAGLIRTAAQRKNHDAKLAEAMVRRSIEYKIGDDTISEAGELLTLTNVEAERMVDDGTGERRLLSRGTVKDLDALLGAIGKKGARMVELTVTPAERVARYIELFSVFFLVGGALGLYIEFKTPGFGLPGIAGICLLAVWFWGHHVAGLAGSAEMVLFAVGATLLFLEIFVIPGFGVAGLSGIILILLAMLMAMVQHYPGLPAYNLPTVHIQSAILKLGIAGTIAFFAMLLLAKFLPETQVFRRVMLTGTLGKGDGFTASRETNDLAGLEGVAATMLRPAGIGVFGDKRLNVVARGAFIDRGSPIVVAETHGNRIVVATLGAATNMPPETGENA